jgi:hypothetical protein
VSASVALRFDAIDDWLAPRIENLDVDPWELMPRVSLGVRLLP